MTDASNALSTLEQSESSAELDDALIRAVDLHYCNEFEVECQARLFNAVCRKLDVFSDREEAMNLLSACAIETGRRGNIDLKPLWEMRDSMPKGELVHLIEILRCLGDASHVEWLQVLGSQHDAEIASDALEAIAEITSRKA